MEIVVCISCKHPYTVLYLFVFKPLNTNVNSKSECRKDVVFCCPWAAFLCRSLSKLSLWLEFGAKLNWMLPTVAAECMKILYFGNKKTKTAVQGYLEQVTFCCPWNLIVYVSSRARVVTYQQAPQLTLASHIPLSSTSTCVVMPAFRYSALTVASCRQLSLPTTLWPCGHVQQLFGCLCVCVSDDNLTTNWPLSLVFWFILTLYKLRLCVRVQGHKAPCGPGAIPLPLIPSLPYHLFYLLVSFTFPFFPFLLASSIILLFHPFPFYPNTPSPFPGWMS